MTDFKQRLAAKYNVPVEEVDLSYSPSEEWKNYGDASPKEHGGIFVRWEDDMWRVIETLRTDTIFIDGSENEWRIDEQYIEPMDLFVDGDPELGPTDSFERVLGRFDLSYETFLTDHQIERAVAEAINYVPTTRESERTPDYWDHLENFGISKEQVQS